MDWSPIPDFPGYSINDRGQVRNDDTGRVLALTRNQHGLVQVGLMRDGVQHKRAVGLLVANMFLEPSSLEAFDAVINLDGDRCNNNVENLMWRPRWFAVKYHKQFQNKKISFRQPIQDLGTGEIFKNSFDAATTFGLLDTEIKVAAVQRTYVWPTYQRFKVMDHRD